MPSEFDLGKLRETFRTWLPFPDYGPVDAVCATYLANQLDGPPVWLVLVPRLDYAKEILFALESLPRVHPVTELSRGSLASGYKSIPPIGLLHEMNDGEAHHIVMPELAEALTRNTQLRAHLCEQLRDVYRGRHQHEFGNGTSVNWEGKIGIITSATEADAYSFQQALGGGLIFWPCTQPAANVATRMAMADADLLEHLRGELAQAMAALATVPFDNAPEVELGELVWRLIADFARVCAKASGHVERNRKSGEIVGTPVHLARPSPLAQLVRGFAILHGAPLPRIEDVQRVLRASLWSIPTPRREVIQVVDLRDGFLRERLERFSDSHERALEELVTLGVLAPIRSAGGQLLHVPSEDSVRFFNTVQRLCWPMNAEFYMDYVRSSS